MEDIKIIETALKENVELKKMIKNFNEAIGEPQIIPPTIEKQLKALEIIKEKSVDVPLLVNCSILEFYNLFARSKKELTQEEYVLLKEVLL